MPLFVIVADYGTNCAGLPIIYDFRTNKWCVRILFLNSHTSSTIHKRRLSNLENAIIHGPLAYPSFWRYIHSQVNEEKNQEQYLCLTSTTRNIHGPVEIELTDRASSYKGVR